MGLQVRASPAGIQMNTFSSHFHASILPHKIASNHACALMNSYNEVILDAEFWTSHLPQVVEAIFFPATSAPGEALARRVRKSFQEAFNYPAHLPPLLRMNLEEGSNGNRMAPFELVED